MKATAAKVGVRVFGTLAGIIGVLLVITSLMMLFPVGFAASLGSVSVIVFTFFGLLVGGYFAYAGYLVWFRFSPSAVRHVCGTTGFFLMGLLTPHGRASSDMLWFVLSFSAVLFGYSFATRRLNRMLFGSIDLIERSKS